MKLPCSHCVYNDYCLLMIYFPLILDSSNPANLGQQQKHTTASATTHNCCQLGCSDKIAGFIQKQWDFFPSLSASSSSSLKKCNCHVSQKLWWLFHHDSDGYSIIVITGWWFEPSEKYESQLGWLETQLIWENKIDGNQTTNQSV